MPFIVWGRREEGVVQAHSSSGQHVA